MKPLIILLLVFGASHFKAQDIPSNRITDWSKAGLHQEISMAKTVNINMFKKFVTENLSYNLALTEAFKALGEKGGVVKFNEGEYFFDQKIDMPSNVVLSGVSSAKTLFTFNLGGKESCISFKGNNSGKALGIVQLTNANSYTIAINGQIAPYSYAFVRYKDKAILESSWAYNHFGQIVYTTGQKGNEITLENPLRFAITNLAIADVLVIKPIVNSGIENVKIVRKDKTKSKTANILFDYAANCFVSGVESNMANFAHVIVQHSAHITVTGCYFHHAFSYGSGGVGYGVLTQYSASDNLIEDNVFEHLRHSMLLQAGANGNVFAYNYSTDPFWIQGFFPSSSAGDIVLHGNYPFLNLFEGNIAQNVVIDGSHGINGPFNTFFRNRLENYGITAIAYPMTNKQNFAANEITSKGFLTGLFVILGVDHFSEFNNIQGEITPSYSTEPKQVSLYGADVSEANRIGAVSNYNTSALSAKTRFETEEFTKFIALYSVGKGKRAVPKEKKETKKWWKFWGRKK